MLLDIYNLSTREYSVESFSTHSCPSSSLVRLQLRCAAAVQEELLLMMIITRTDQLCIFFRGRQPTEMFLPNHYGCMSSGQVGSFGRDGVSRPSIWPELRGGGIDLFGKAQEMR